MDSPIGGSIHCHNGTDIQVYMAVRPYRPDRIRDNQDGPKPETMIFRTIRHFTAQDGTHYNCGKEITSAEFALVHESDIDNFMAIPDGPRLVSVPPPQKKLELPDTDPYKSSWDPAPDTGLGFNYPYNLF